MAGNRATDPVSHSKPQSRPKSKTEPTLIRRRDFLKRTAGAAAGIGAAGVSAVSLSGALNGCSPQSEGPAVHTRPTVNWRLSSSFPRSLDTLYGSCDVLAARVRALSDDRFNIRVYPAGEIVPGLQVMDAVQQGTVQVGQTASYYFTGKNPALAFDACVPFGLSSRQQTAWLYEGGGLELMRQLFADFNIVTFPAGNTGVQMGGWFQREIGSAQELRGLKMRIPGLGGEVMSQLGVTVQVLAGGDIFPALERGAIDATEWVGPSDDEKLGFYKIAKYYYYPGWWEPGPSLSFYVNRAAWDKLPRGYQEIFDTAAKEAAVTMQARYDVQNPPALKRLLAAGVTMRPFPDDIMSAARQVSLEILEEEAARDTTYRRIYDQWKKARTDSFDWFATAELAYARFAFGTS